MRKLLCLSFVKEYFNSIKVRLEQLQFFVVASYKQFQFHKGTIRTVVSVDTTIIHHEFQFHKGTIRTFDGGFFDAFSDISIP